MFSLFRNPGAVSLRDYLSLIAVLDGRLGVPSLRLTGRLNFYLSNSRFILNRRLVRVLSCRLSFSNRYGLFGGRLNLHVFLSDGNRRLRSFVSTRLHVRGGDLSVR